MRTTKITAIARGSAVGAVFGTGALAVVVGVAHLWLERGVTVPGVLALAVPLVLLPFICGGLASLWFSRSRRSRPAAAFDGAMFYPGSIGIGCLAFVTDLATHHRPLGESFLALPILYLSCAVAGALAIAAAAVVISRFNLPGADDENMA